MKKIFISAVLLVMAASCHKQGSSPAANPQQQEKSMLNIFSPAFQNNGAIPEKYSCKGQGINPPLIISGVPQTAKTLALILHDPDAPAAGGYTHWVLYNISPTTTSISENSVPAGADQGNNGSGKASYTGPCPPSGTHRYHFYLYALDTKLEFQTPPAQAQMEEIMRGHILSQADLVGTFSH